MVCYAWITCQPHNKSTGHSASKTRVNALKANPPYTAGHSQASLRQVLEIAQIRRRLVLADRHQHAVSAHEIALLADGDHRVGLDAGALGPAVTHIVSIFLVHGPGPSQRTIVYGDDVVKDCRIGLVAEDPFLEDRLVVEVKRQAGCVIGAGTFEGPAGFDL